MDMVCMVVVVSQRLRTFTFCQMFMSLNPVVGWGMGGCLKGGAQDADTAFCSCPSLHAWEEVLGYAKERNSSLAPPQKKCPVKKRQESSLSLIYQTGHGQIYVWIVYRSIYTKDTEFTEIRLVRKNVHVVQEFFKGATCRNLYSTLQTN